MSLLIVSDIWHKFWIYGGVFYATLFILFVIKVISYKRHYKIFEYFPLLLLSVLIIVSISQIFILVKGFADTYTNFKLSEKKKTSIGTFAVKPVANRLKQSADYNKEDMVCYMYTWDIPNNYFLVLMYPNPAKVISSLQSLPSDCDYLVSQYEMIVHKEFSLFEVVDDQSRLSYLYKKVKL